MPRQKSTSKFATILAFFQTSSMEVAEFALDLCQGAVRERKAKGQKVIAGRAKAHGASASGGDADAPAQSPASVAADKATASIGTPAAAKARRKPGPPKGRKRGANKASGGKGNGADVAAATHEVTDAEALPPQAPVHEESEPVLNL